MIVKVTKVVGGEAMRSDTMTGWIRGGRWPELGESLIVANRSPLDSSNNENLRMLQTSEIVAYGYVDATLRRSFTTKTGSIYEVEEINDNTEE